MRHKGELVYPNLMLSCSADHVAAFVLRPLAVDRTRDRVPAAVRSREVVAAGDFDPSDAGDFWDLVNQQDWAICESVQRGMSSRAYTHGWFAPMEDDSRRHPALAAAEARRIEPSTLTGTTSSSSASARSAARRPCTCARRGQSGARARAVRARAPAAAPRHDTSRILRHSYHTPGYVRLTQEAYDDWAQLER